MQIVAYDSRFYAKVEKFRAQTFEEGNEALIHEKLSLNSSQGNLLLCIVDDQVVSISLAEPSHYTGDPHVACRICRYHVLREYRKKFLFCGFQMLERHCAWADQQGFKVIYWTHDVKNHALNRLYQRRSKYSFGVSNEWFNKKPYIEFQLLSDKLFKVSSKSHMLQYIYARFNPHNYVWKPKELVVSALSVDLYDM